MSMGPLPVSYTHLDVYKRQVIAEVDDHYAKCTLEVQERHRNAMGAVMGGVYFTLADFAFAVAANWQEIGTVSLHSDIAYLGTAKGTVSYTHLYFDPFFIKRQFYLF